MGEITVKRGKRRNRSGQSNCQADQRPGNNGKDTRSFAGACLPGPVDQKSVAGRQGTPSAGPPQTRVNYLNESFLITVVRGSGGAGCWYTNQMPLGGQGDCASASGRAVWMPRGFSLQSLPGIMPAGCTGLLLRCCQGRPPR